MSRLQFNEEGHTYTLDGKKILSVTQILSSLGISDYSWVLQKAIDEAAIRGKAVHKLIEMWDMGQIRGVPEWASPYLGGWEKWKERMAVKILCCEKRVFNEAYWFCGTLDRIVLIHGVEYLVDIKTTASPMWSHTIQTAGYAFAYKKEKKIKSLRRAAIYLRANGEWSFIRHENKTDEDVFLSAAKIANTKIQHEK
jgi:hypothetical protein